MLCVGKVKSQNHLHLHFNILHELTKAIWLREHFGYLGPDERGPIIWYKMHH